MIKWASFPAPASPHDEATWTRGTRAALMASAVLVALLLVTLAYRLTLPTDGWTLSTVSDVTSFDTNLLGLPSALQRGDALLAIQGRLPNTASGLRFRAGDTETYTVRRASQTLSLPVPLGDWTAPALLDAFRADPGNLFSGLIYFLIGLFVFARRPANLAAQVLFWLGTVRLTMVSVFLVPATTADQLDFPAAALLGFVGYVSWIFMLFPTVLLLALVFPKPKRPIRTHPRLTLAALYLPGPVLLLALSPFGQASRWAGVVHLIVYEVLTVVSVVHSFVTSRRDAVARAQILWVLFGVAVTALLGIVSVTAWLLDPAIAAAHPDLWQQVLVLIFSTALPLTIAIAILRYHLFDIEILIHRTLVYSLLTALLLLVYLVSVTVIQTALSTLSGQRSDFAIIFSTLVIAALFSPLRRRIQSIIDRRFYRRKYDAARVLAAFGATVRDEVDLNKLTEELVGVVQETMQPAQVSVWLRVPETEAGTSDT